MAWYLCDECSHATPPPFFLLLLLLLLLLSAAYNERMESTTCNSNPLALGYTRGHFSALVTCEPLPAGADGQSPRRADSRTLGHVVQLPLMTSTRHVLPVHFLADR